jgi:hypothetical protein
MRQLKGIVVAALIGLEAMCSSAKADMSRYIDSYNSASQEMMKGKRDYNEVFKALDKAVESYMTLSASEKKENRQEIWDIVKKAEDERRQDIVNSYLSKHCTGIGIHASLLFNMMKSRYTTHHILNVLENQYGNDSDPYWQQNGLQLVDNLRSILPAYSKAHCKMALGQ